MSRGNPEESSGDDHPRGSERSASGQHATSTDTSRSPQEQEPPEPTPLFSPPWERIGWYVLGTIPATVGYAFTIGAVGFLIAEPTAMFVPLGFLIALLAAGFLLGLLVVLVRRPRVVLYESLTAAGVLVTASTIVPAFTSITSTTLWATGFFWLVPATLAVGWHRYTRWRSPQRSTLRRQLRR